MTLCVTPFLVSAQGNDSSRMLLELQSLRQEVAELRDMVERQEYQMRKLQNPPRRSGPQTLANSGDNDGGGRLTRNGDRAGRETFSVDGANPSRSSRSGDDSFLNDDFPADGSSRSSASSSSSSYRTYSRDGGDSVDGIVTEGQDSINGVNERDQSNVIGDRDAYDQPFDDGGTGASVSESPINAPRVRNSDRYPPVVDRSVGSNNDDIRDNTDGSRQSENADSVQDRYDEFDDNASLDSNRRSQRIPSRQPLDAEVANNRVPSNNGAGVISVPQPLTNDGITTALSEQDYYQQGFELLKKSEHEQAVSIFNQQIKAYPQGDYADDAHYWVAESMYVNRKLGESKASFKAIINDYKQSPRLPDALLKTAYIEQEQGNEIEARILLQEIMQFHPRSNAAISAKNRLAELK